MAKTTKTGAKAGLASELSAVDEAGAAAALASAGERGVELVEAWVAASNAAALAVVADDESVAAPSRKAARRGLAVLKSRGVAPPERHHVAKLGAKEPETLEAYFVAPDPTGAFVLTIAARTKNGRARMVDVAIRDRFGVLRVGNGEASKSDLRRSFDDIERRAGFSPVEVPVEWARFRIAKARAENATSGAVLPLGLDRAADLVSPAPAAEPAHPIDVAAVAISDAEGAVARSVDLHAEPEFRSWLPDGRAAQDMLVRIGSAIGEGGGSDQEKVDAAVGAEIDAATDRFFSPEVREVLIGRMRDAAISVLARAGAARAGDVLATVDAVRSAGLVTSTPREIPFLRGFFQKVLAIMAAQGGGQITVPVPAGDAAIERAEAAAKLGEKVSAGGIILP